MDKFCDFITDPAWWSVIATIIAAAVAAVITYVLGRRQNELQQQQLKLQEQQNKIQEYQTKLQEQQIQQQEYELYRKIYTYIVELDTFSKILLHKIVVTLTNNEDNKLRLKQIDGIWQEYEKLSDEFTECTIDIELKQCGEVPDVKVYFDALRASSKVILMFKYFIEQELLIFDPSLAYNAQVEKHTTPPVVLIDIILRLFKGSNHHLLRSELLAYVSIVEKTNQAQLLKVIKDRITPKNTE